MSTTLTSLTDINQIVVDLESVLRIEGEDLSKPFPTAMEDIRRKCTIFYNADFTKDTPTEIQNTQYAQFYENTLLSQVKLANIFHQCIWRQEAIVALRNVHFLSRGPENCAKLFRSLSNADYCTAVKEAVPHFAEQVYLLTNSLEKRLFFSMFVAYDLGRYELAGVIASIFICGGF